MGLAAPLALFLLALASIPLWIHRVRKRSLVSRRLPTIALLARAVEQQRRHVSFRDRRLLYARIALTALLAFALARPYLSRIASYESERPVALAIIVDDSMSMGRKKDRTSSLLEAACQRAEQVVSELAPESEVTVVLGGREARIWLRREKSLDAARERLRAIASPGARGTDLAHALELAVAQLGASALPDREVLVLSDCDQHAGTSGLVHTQVHVRTECLKPRPAPPNAFITTLALDSARDASEARTLQIAVRSAVDVNELVVDVRLDGKRYAREPVPLRAGEGALELALPQAALATAHVVRAQIDTANAITADDARELRLDAEGTSHVLLVDGDPASTNMDDELRYVSLALSLAGNSDELRMTRIDADGLDATPLADFDVVVLGNVRAPQGAAVDELKRFVTRGGGLLIGAGDNVDAFAYRGAFGPLLPAVVRSSAPSDPPATVPVGSASEFLPDAARGLETTRTWKRLLLEAAGPDAQVPVAFGDGAPLIATTAHGAGRVALFTTSFDDAWTDIPLSPGFLPLLHELVRALSPAAALPPGPHVAGTILSARVPSGVAAVYMLTPDGRRVDLTAERGAVHIEDTATPGIYRVFTPEKRAGSGELPHLTFTVVPDVRDSDTTPGSAVEVRAQKNQPGVGHPRGVDPWFWLALGLVALAEGLLRRNPQPSPARA